LILFTPKSGSVLNGFLV